MATGFQNKLLSWLAQVWLSAKICSTSQGIATDMTTFYRHFDVGVDLGLAYNITKSLGIEGRYNYGFKDLVNTIITDNNGNFISQGKTGANSVLQLGFYYFFLP